MHCPLSQRNSMTSRHSEHTNRPRHHAKHTGANRKGYNNYWQASWISAFVHSFIHSSFSQSRTLAELLLVSMCQVAACNSQLHFFLAGGSTPNILFPRVRDPHLTQFVSLDPTSVPAKWHRNSAHGLSMVHECDRQTNDRRQTDRQT